MTRLSFEVVCYSRVYRRRNRLREGPTFTAEQSYFWIIWLFLNSCSPPPPLPLCYLRQEINELGFLLSEGGNTTLKFPRGKLFQHDQTICYLGKQKDSPGPLKSPTWRKVTWKKVFLKEWLEDMDRRPRFWPLLAMWLISFKIFIFLTFCFILAYSQLAIFWSFQVDSKRVQPCMYINPFSSKLPSPSRLPHNMAMWLQMSFFL